MPSCTTKRKQNKPAKVDAIDGVDSCVGVDSDKFLEACCLFGPFEVKQLDPGSEGTQPERSKTFKLADSTGKTHFLEPAKEFSFLLQTSTTRDCNKANALFMLHDPTTLYLLTLEDVNGFKNLNGLLIMSPDVTTPQLLKTESPGGSMIQDLRVPTASERTRKDVLKRYSCLVCNHRFETPNDLVVHFKDCNPRALSSMSKNEGSLPVLSRYPEPSPPIEDADRLDHDKNNSLKRDDNSLKSQAAKVDTAKIHMDLSAKLSAPILLPVAVHDGDGVKVLGSPQFIIPVAVGRGTVMADPSILLHPQLSKNIKIPQQLRIDNGLEGFFINLSEALTSNTFSQTLASPTTSVNNVQAPTGPQKRKHDDSPYFPLDLSRKIPKISPMLPLRPAAAMSLPKNLASSNNNLMKLNQLIMTPSLPFLGNPAVSSHQLHQEEPKKFRCVCGIDFNNAGTYEGHKSFYCRLRLHADEQNNKQNAVKVPENCPHCEFVPSSASHLNQHIRQQHSPSKCYVCGLCGYRGFSVRGIRCHIKDHMNESGNAGAELEAIVTNLYREVSINSKNFPPMDH